MKLKRIAATLALILAGSLGRLACADNIELPGRGITADSQIVVRGDLTAISADTLEKSKTIIIAMLGDAAKDSGPSKDQWQQLLDSREAMVKSGVQQFVVVIGGFPQGAAATLKPALFLKLKPGTDPAAVEKAMKDVDAANAKRTGNPADLDKASVKSLDGDWAYVAGDQFDNPAATGDQKNLTAFQNSLGKQDGAPIRLALQLNDSTKTSMAATAATAQIPPFVKNLLDGLQTLQTASAGITTGDVLTLSVNGSFPTPDAAAAFKKSLDAALAVVPALAPPEAQAQIAVVVAILTMKTDGATLANTTDSDKIKAVIKAAAPAPAPAPGAAPAPQN